MTTPANQASVRQISRLLKRLSLEEDDILLIKKSAFPDQEILEILKQGIQRLGVTRVLAVVVQEFDDLKTVNRLEMNKHGWYHIEQINHLTNVLRK